MKLVPASATVREMQTTNTANSCAFAPTSNKLYALCIARLRIQLVWLKLCLQDSATYSPASRLEFPIYPLRDREYTII
jgi:hypothetical protein